MSKLGHSDYLKIKDFGDHIRTTIEVGTSNGNYITGEEIYKTVNENLESYLEIPRELAEITNLYPLLFRTFICPNYTPKVSINGERGLRIDGYNEEKSTEAFTENLPELMKRLRDSKRLYENVFDFT